MRTASIRLDVTPEQMAALVAVRAAYADACNRLVAIVIEHRCWNLVALHKLAYTRLRNETPLGSQMACNAIFAVCKTYRAQKELGHIRQDAPVPAIRFDQGSVHYDTRTYTIKGDTVSLNTLNGRIVVPLMLGQHQHRLLQGGALKEAELVFRKGKWFFNLVIESGDGEQVASGPVMGVDVGENNLAAISLGKVFGGDQLGDKRDRYLAGGFDSHSHQNQGWEKSAREAEYKASAAGIAVEYVNPAYTSQTCAECGGIGKRAKHRFECPCGLRAHSDLNASRNLARIGRTAVLPKAVVNTPYVGNVVSNIHVSQ